MKPETNPHTQKKLFDTITPLLRGLLKRVKNHTFYWSQLYLSTVIAVGIVVGVAFTCDVTAMVRRMNYLT